MIADRDFKDDKVEYMATLNSSWVGRGTIGGVQLSTWQERLFEKRAEIFNKCVRPTDQGTSKWLLQLHIRN